MAISKKTEIVPAFSMCDISKRFGSVRANDSVNFKVFPGEIHALLGENGSGKSTLMNILSGIYRADSGDLEIFGEKYHFKSPSDSIKCGIGMVHQHYKLSEALTASENIVAGVYKGVTTHDEELDNLRSEIFKYALLSPKKTSEKIKRFAQHYGIEIDPSALASELSVSQKQSVEIVKVLIRGARILILDEPTAVLTPQETRQLFKVLRSMAEMGCAIVFISHKLNEIMTLCDRVTVLRKGRSVETCNVSDVDTYELVEKMVGRKVDLSINRPPKSPEEKVCLDIQSLSYSDDKGIQKVKDLSFKSHYGEILGVAGLAGGGQKELCEIVSGIIPPKEGRVFVDDEDIAGLSPREISHKGVSMCFIPEDRLGMGLVASMGIVENLLLKEYAFQKGIFVHTESLEEKADQIVDELSIQTPGLNHPVRMLSGGNIQKVILGREIYLHPKLMIAAYAVRGLDINSSFTIYNLLNEQKKKGVSVLYIGEDLDVLIELCDRILVLCQGENMGIVDAKKTSKEQIGQMMSGTSLDVLNRGVDYVSNR